MLPGNGSVVANASGTGVHEREGYCGQGGGGGLMPRAAAWSLTSLLSVGMRIGFAEADAAIASEATRVAMVGTQSFFTKNATERPAGNLRRRQRPDETFSWASRSRSRTSRRRSGPAAALPGGC